MTRRARPAWWTAADEAADRAARYGGDSTPSAGRPGGVLAFHDGFCWKCDRTIVRGESRVMPHGDSWICIDCAGKGE